MVRYVQTIRNPGYVAPRRFIGPVRSTAMANRTVARQRLANRGFKPGYSRTSGFYGRYGQAAIQQGLVPEKKFFDTLINFNFDATAEVPATGQLVLIPQGDTESTRDGRQCTVVSVQGRLLWTFAPAAAATATTTCFLYLIQDTQANGGAAAATDIFTSTNASIALHNLANSSRFLVLKKWKKTFNPQAGVSTAYNNTTYAMEFFKKCNMKLEFSGTTGAITELKSNNLFFYAGSDTLSDDTVSCSGFCRIRFRG